MRVEASAPAAVSSIDEAFHGLSDAKFETSKLPGLQVGNNDDFPADDAGYGFDNIGDVLSVPPLLLEKYLAAAEKIAVVRSPQRGFDATATFTPGAKYALVGNAGGYVVLRRM